MRERDLLEHIYRCNSKLAGRVTIPPGDDMGAISIGASQLLVTVDQVVDAIHVDLASTPVEKIGRKALTRNLSDVAAMAAKPLGAVAAACLPRSMNEDQAQRLFDAMRETGEAFGCPLIGGDIAMWEQSLLISVTVFAEPAGIEPVLRKGARVGDAIYVSGVLGGSTEIVRGSSHHLDFEPRLELARALAGSDETRPHCMIDLSDGLARDLLHLCKAAGVRAQVQADRLPISEAAVQAAGRSGRAAWQHAVGDGEDYELLFTALPGVIPPQVRGVPITCIGSIASTDGGEPGIDLWLADGSRADLSQLGWEHHT
jgi:thiamine-monophosphate kinase